MTFKSDSENARPAGAVPDCLSWRASAASWVAMSAGGWTAIWVLARAIAAAAP